MISRAAALPTGFEGSNCVAAKGRRGRGGHGGVGVRVVVLVGWDLLSLYALRVVHMKVGT
jgi:hypothetical protein